MKDMTIVSTIVDGDKKLLGLEVMRFIAAFAILVWHYQHFTFNLSINFVREEQPFYSWLKNEMNVSHLPGGRNPK